MSKSDLISELLKHAEMLRSRAVDKFKMDTLGCNQYLARANTFGEIASLFSGDHE